MMKKKECFFLLSLMLLLCSQVIFAISYSQKILADNPLVYYRLGETGTTAADATGNYDATYYGTITRNVSSPLVNDPNKAISTGAGTDHYIRKSSFNAFSTTAVSAEFWMKSSDKNNSGSPISYAVGNMDNEFLIYNYQNLGIYVNGSHVDTGISLTNGNWHHVVITWQSSGGTTKLYVDKSLVYSGNLQAGSSIHAGGTLVLGQEQDSVGGNFDPSQTFVGSLDEVAIYSHVLSASQIASHYDVATAVPEPTSLILGFIALSVVWLYHKP